MEKWLNSWITQFVVANDSSSEELKSKYPLREAQVTVEEVKGALQAKFPRFYASRQKLSLEDSKKTLSDEKTIAEVLADEGRSSTDVSELTFSVKDLGPQISWKTVFLVEYLGPLIIHPVVYHLSGTIYRQNFEHSQLQTVTYGLVLAHFLKRELETLFVHRFSHATMPFTNIFKNSAHYHLLSGILLAGGVYGPWYSSQALAGSRRADPKWIAGFSALWLVAELLNLQAHVTLRNLRPPGTKTRGIPRGGLFEYVSCPNYLSETLAWAAITGLTLSPFALLFLVVSTVQMGVWALKKHHAYKKEFGTKYPRRKAMIPFIF